MLTFAAVGCPMHWFVSIEASFHVQTKEGEDKGEDNEPSCVMVRLNQSVAGTWDLEPAD